MEMTKEEIKTKLLEIKAILGWASLGYLASIGTGNYCYASDCLETGIQFWGYENAVWTQSTVLWENISDADYEKLAKFVKLKYPKEYEVTRKTYLINFLNTDSKETLAVNLKDKTFVKTYVGKKDRVIKYPNSFFKGMDGRVVASKIPSDDNFKKLVETIIRKESNCSNFGTFLIRLFDNIHLETYISAGVEFDYRITVGYDFFDKDVRTILNKHKFKYNETVASFFTNNHDLGKSMLYFIKDETDFTNLFNEISRNMRDINILVDTYKYDVKRLFEYCKERNWSSGRRTWGAKDLISFMCDYARMADVVFPNGFEKYPKDIVDHHDGVTKLYEKEKIKFDDIAFAKLIDEKMEYKTKEFCMIYPKSTGDIQSEGRLLSHCVSYYVPYVMNDSYTILFMSSNKAKDTPLVTVEIRNGRVTQARGRCNRSLSYEEKLFLTEYAEKKKVVYTPTAY